MVVCLSSRSLFEKFVVDVENGQELQEDLHRRVVCDRNDARSSASNRHAYERQECNNALS